MGASNATRGYPRERTVRADASVRRIGVRISGDFLVCVADGGRLRDHPGSSFRLVAFGDDVVVAFAVLFFVNVLVGRDSRGERGEGGQCTLMAPAARV